MPNLVQIIARAPDEVQRLRDQSVKTEGNQWKPIRQSKQQLQTEKWKGVSRESDSEAIERLMKDKHQVLKTN